MSGKLPASWPPVARDILLDAARYYYRAMKDEFPVPDVIMEQALDWANKELERRQQEIYEQAGPRWIKRYESGRLDAEMKRAIEDTYGRLSRAERSIRPRSGARSRQLDAEIDHALRRGKICR